MFAENPVSYGVLKSKMEGGSSDGRSAGIKQLKVDKPQF